MKRSLRLLLFAGIWTATCAGVARNVASGPQGGQMLTALNPSAGNAMNSFNPTDFLKKMKDSGTLVRLKNEILHKLAPDNNGSTLADLKVVVTLINNEKDCDGCRIDVPIAPYLRDGTKVGNLLQLQALLDELFEGIAHELPDYAKDSLRSFKEAFGLDTTKDVINAGQ